LSAYREFSKGIVAQNPVFRIVLGLCPTLAVSTAVKNGVGMGLAATFVLVGSNAIISLIRNIVPSRIRIPCYIVVIATFVTIVDLVMAASDCCQLHHTWASRGFRKQEFFCNVDT